MWRAPRGRHPQPCIRRAPDSPRLRWSLLFYSQGTAISAIDHLPQIAVRVVHRESSAHAFSRLLTPSHAFSRLLTPSHAFSSLLKPSHAFSQVRVVHRESSAHAQVWLRAGADGALDIYHRSLRIGPHDVWVVLNNNPLPGCPYHLTVRAGNVCAEACTLEGLPLLSAPHRPPPLHFAPHPQLASQQRKDAFDGEPLRIPPLSAPFPFPTPPPLEVEAQAGQTTICQLTVRDKFGNARPPPTSHLTARLVRDGDGQETDVSISRTNPRHAAGPHAAEFLVHLTPLTAGWHELRCSDTTGAAAAVVRVHVRAGTSPSCTLVPGTALVGTPLLSAQWISFDLEPSDALGNPLEHPKSVRDTPLPHIHSSTCAPTHPPRIVRHDAPPNGGWSVQLMPAFAGAHDLNIAIGNTPAFGSPFVLDVRPGVVHAKRCTASGDGLMQTLPQQLATFTIEARDIFGNRCRFGGQAFSVTIAPRAHGHYGTVDRVTDNDDGSHTVHYTCAVSGSYSVQISHGRAPIDGSPFALTCWAEDDSRAPPHLLAKSRPTRPTHPSSPAKGAASGRAGALGSPARHGGGGGIGASNAYMSPRDARALGPHTGQSARESSPQGGMWHEGSTSSQYSNVSARYMQLYPAHAAAEATERTKSPPSPRRSASTPYLAGYSPRFHAARQESPSSRPTPRQPWAVPSAMAASPSEPPPSAGRPFAVQPPPSPHVWSSPAFRGAVGAPPSSAPSRSSVGSSIGAGIRTPRTANHALASPQRAAWAAAAQREREAVAARHATRTSQIRERVAQRASAHQVGARVASLAAAGSQWEAASDGHVWVADADEGGWMEDVSDGYSESLSLRRFCPS